MKKMMLWFLVLSVLFAAFGCENGHSHEMVYHEEITPDCKNAGQMAYYECRDCGKRFADEKGGEEISTITLGLGEHRYAPSACLSVEKHSEVCEICGDSVEVVHHVVPLETGNVGRVYSGACVCGYRETHTTLPTICVTTEDGDAIGIVDGVPEGTEYNSEHNYETVYIDVESDVEGEKMSSVLGEMKIRGNWSTTYSDKKPYRIKFDKKQSLLGLNDGLEAKSWVLLAEYKDRSLMRNATAFFLGDRLLGADGYYCSDYCFVDLYVNDEYRGVYLLCEQQQTGEGRVDIPEPEKNSDETAIGYLIELDYYYTDEKPTERFTVSYPGSGFVGWDGKRVDPLYYIKGYSIKSDIYSQKQTDHIRKVVENILTVVDRAIEKGEFDTIDAEGNIVDSNYTTVEECVGAVIDVRSLIDTFLLNEICMDMDVGYSSFLLSIDMSENGAHQLVFEAPWDWDSSLGFAINAQDFIMSAQIFPANGQTGSPTPRSYVNPWLVMLANQDWYRKAVAARWAEFRATGAIEEAEERIELFRASFHAYAKKNAERWPGWPSFREGSSTEGYVAAVNNTMSLRYLSSFLRQRTGYLDVIFGYTPLPS